MLDHVFTDVIGALRDAFESAFLERQAFEEHFRVDVLLGDVSWETSYGLPGEGLPPRVVAHIAFDWPSWSQAAYRKWYLDGELDDQPAIEMEISLRVQRIATPPDLALIRHLLPDTSPLIGNGRLERAEVTVETIYSTSNELDHESFMSTDAPEAGSPAEHAVEVTYEGLYELAEESLADGASTLLDEHFGALGGWIATMLVKLGDVKYTYLPATETE